MHSAFEMDFIGKDGGEDLVAIAALVTEGRIPNKLSSKTKGFSEGPHSPLNKSPTGHKCDLNDDLCSSYGQIRHQILDSWKKNIPVCLEVLLTCSCKIDDDLKSDNCDDDILLEKWYLSLNYRRIAEPLFFNFVQLLNAIRSQLYFSQLTAWMTSQTDILKMTPNNLRYRLSIPGETYESTKFALNATKHDFPLTDLGNGYTVNVSFWSLPRTTKMPELKCRKCTPKQNDSRARTDESLRKYMCKLLDDRMHTVCTIKGKHRCEDFEDLEHLIRSNNQSNLNKRLCQEDAYKSNEKDLDRGRLLLEAIERVGHNNKGRSTNCVQNECCSSSDIKGICDKSESDITSIKYEYCDSPMPTKTKYKHELTHSKAKKKITFDEDDREIPSASEQAQFRKDLDNAASMVFHSRTGLPLTSSPAPIRRGKSCFDFDSSINSVSAIKSALFPTTAYDENESDCSIVSPNSPETCNTEPARERTPVKYRRKGHAANLLGSFEESVLNGRLEPVSTVHGFTAELGASGSFVPKHLTVPVTVFFYTLGDNDKVSSPYLGHINLGRKGYNVPKCGTVQVTLFNPLGTVVKMFVIMYDLNDMPPNSQTFVRQRTLYMPINCKDTNVEWGPKWLRYLIHLRFMSSKSGKIYLHSDIRMIIFRKSDLDTATAHGIDMSYELRSFTHMPVNPRFSPRK